jgi:hypothetical protein
MIASVLILRAFIMSFCRSSSGAGVMSSAHSNFSQSRRNLVWMMQMSRPSIRYCAVLFFFSVTASSLGQTPAAGSSDPKPPQQKPRPYVSFFWGAYEWGDPPKPVKPGLETGLKQAQRAVTGVLENCPVDARKSWLGGAIEICSETR